MEQVGIFILLIGGFIIYLFIMLAWRNPKMFLPKCKNCRRPAKWEFADNKTGEKYHFCTKKCEKEYQNRECSKNKKTQVTNNWECSMDIKDRTKFFTETLNQLFLRDEGSFLIFENIETGKFVQFTASSKAKQLLLDIPIKKQGFSKGQQDTLSHLIEFDNDSVELFPGDDPFQVSFINKTDYAVRIVDRIFIEVFNLPNDYKLNITIG